MSPELVVRMVPMPVDSGSADSGPTDTGPAGPVPADLTSNDRLPPTQLTPTQLPSTQLPSVQQPIDAGLMAIMIRHEGWRTHPYSDSVGKLTIGVGRNLTDRGLAADEIALLLANDLALARQDCLTLFGQSFRNATPVRQHALLSMAFNLGLPRLAGFRRMRRAILSGDWEQAAREAKDSRWARQVGGRSDEIATWLTRG